MGSIYFGNNGKTKEVDIILESMSTVITTGTGNIIFSITHSLISTQISYIIAYTGHNLLEIHHSATTAEF